LGDRHRRPHACLGDPASSERWAATCEWLDRLPLAIELAAARAEDGLDPTLLRRLRGLAAAHKRGDSGAAYSRRMSRPPPMLVPGDPATVAAVDRSSRVGIVCWVCGYAIVVREVPDSCLMYGSSAWDHQPGSPFSLRSRYA
jgi:hypothetical protein